MAKRIADKARERVARKPMAKSAQGWAGVKSFETAEGNDAVVNGLKARSLVVNATGLTKAELLERTPVIITTLGENGSLITELAHRYPGFKE